MNRPSWKSYALWIVLTQAVGLLSGWLSRQGIGSYQELIRQPPLSPPAVLFPLVWTVLFTLMAVGAARVESAPASPARSRALALYLLQLAFNFLWSILFFRFGRFGLALVWLVALWGLIWWMKKLFGQVDPTAGRLQLPYLLWVAFAAYLNLGVWLLNR